MMRKRIGTDIQDVTKTDRAGLVSVRQMIPMDQCLEATRLSLPADEEEVSTAARCAAMTTTH